MLAACHGLLKFQEDNNLKVHKITFLSASRIMQSMPFRQHPLRKPVAPSEKLFIVPKDVGTAEQKW